MRGIWVVISALIMIGFSGCEKSILDNCAASGGKITKEDRGHPEIHYIHLSDNINLILEQGNSPSLQVEAGKNLLPDIITEVKNGELYIRNENKCNWLRSYNKEVNVYLTIAALDSLDYYGSGDIFSVNALKSDSIRIDVWEGSGSIRLQLDVPTSHLNLHFGTVDFNVTGRSNVTYIYAASYGPFNCGDLDSKFVYINNKGSNNCYVRASVHLVATIEYLGNIYYYGNPGTIHTDISGDGKLIHLEN